MRIVCLGGGPAGLYFALLMKRLDPRHQITVVERNRPYDTFGWGVVFSDATLDTMRRWDRETADAIEQAFAHWDDIELRFKGRRIRSGGHGFVGIGRKRLLNILQARCESLGVELRFECEADSDLDFPDADLVIAADGINSKVRTRYADVFRPDIVVRPNRYIWLGTPRRFEAFTFDFQRTEHGWFQAHIYQFDAETSTCIVECPESVWQAHGLASASADESVAFCERLFADTLNGAPLLTNARHLRGSAWLNFQRVICEQWWVRNAHGSHVVLMGDAVHTAHFAIGSGTKLALEDGVELVRQFQKLGDTPERLPAVLDAFQAARRIETLRLQNAAWNAMEWFEVCGARYCDQLEPEQFMYSLLTRSQRISHENLRLRDAAWLEGYEQWFESQASSAAVEPSAHVEAPAAGRPTPPMFTPFAVRSVQLKNRVVVSPMAQYSAVNGVPGDFHLVHLGARALGGAALVMAEMTAPSPEARITPGCPGLWNDEQQTAWQRIVQFAHAHSDAKIGLQLGHSGAKGSTQRGWERADHPLPVDGPEPNWPLVSASPQQYLPGVSAPAREITRDDMTVVREAFVASTGRAAAAGFDWLELHCAHGYLLSSFISPLTNQRTDEYGGDLASRLRYPLEVFAAVRQAWPAHLPISVRISAHDWVEGGITPADAVDIARAFKRAGADLIDCSSGQVSVRARPTYGRMYQTPFADRIRQEAGIATIAVGAISEADHVNSIIAAGRADLCAVARPHLANPAWTLTEAARVGYKAIAWPAPYVSGKSQIESLFTRAAAGAAVPVADGFDAGQPAARGLMTALAGTHALVTGAGRGIGAAIAARLAAEGARVTLLGRTRDTLEHTAQQLAAKHPDSVAGVVCCDVTDAGAFAAAVQAMPRVDVLVNNAGQATSAPALRTSDALWAQMLAVNLTAPFTCTRAVLPSMLDAGWGRVVTIASTAALRGYPYVAAYAAAKHGVLGFTRALALELATKGVTVNAVCPGFTDTELLHESIANIMQRTGRSETEARATLAALNPQQRFVTPDDVAHVVIGLCSPAAGSLTGLAIPVSGGEVM